jgi:transposase
MRRRGRHIDICWQCVAEDRRPYLRRLWMLGWAAVCSEHRTVLSGDCPHCRRGILLPPLSATSPIDPLACQRCGEQLAGANTRAAHPLVIALQDMLIAGKRTGAVVLPGVGETDWVTMIAVADMLFGMIWTDVAETHREGLFRRISRDLALDAEDRVALSLANNTGGLLILSWLLEDLQSRLPAAIAILRSVRFNGLLGRLPDVDDDMAARLRTILAPAIATPPTGRGAWRPWVAGLPESAEHLRTRAVSERYKHRRQRLTALAELKDGASVVAASAVAGVLPKTVYRWLDRGAEYGLEAILERPGGRPTLTSAQAESLAQWIAADRPNQYCRKVIDRAATQFGVALSTTAASKLLAKHRRAERGHRRRLWRPKPSALMA